MTSEYPHAHDHGHGHDHSHHDPQHHHEHDAACEVAHGTVPALAADRTLVAVFDTPVARYLLKYAADAGYRTVLVEPDGELAKRAMELGLELDVRTAIGAVPDSDSDVVVTDHHRGEIGIMLRDALASPARWVGIMGSPRVEPPHVEALALLGVEPDEVARVRRPIGLNIGSKTPPEIAIATLAGLIADRNECPGGFDFG